MLVAICEDNGEMQARLKETIEDWAQARRTGVDIFSYPSAEAFLAAWPEISFDLAFLDIEMKHMTGFELAELIRKNDSNMSIVFLTSHSQYVLKGYDVNALHYLIKPLSTAKLLPVLDKAQMIYRSLIESFIIIPSGAGQLKLKHSEILYISISAHTATVHARENRYEIRSTMDNLTENLPDYFVRCYRSIIVNLFSVDCVYKNTLLLSNNETLPLSRSNSKDVNNAFMRLHIGTVGT